MITVNWLKKKESNCLYTDCFEISHKKMGVQFFYNHEKTLKMHFTLAKTLIEKRYKQIKLYMFELLSFFSTLPQHNNLKKDIVHLLLQTEQST